MGKTEVTEAMAAYGNMPRKKKRHGKSYSHISSLSKKAKARNFGQKLDSPRIGATELDPKTLLALK